MWGIAANHHTGLWSHSISASVHCIPIHHSLISDTLKAHCWHYQHGRSYYHWQHERLATPTVNISHPILSSENWLDTAIVCHPNLYWDWLLVRGCRILHSRHPWLHSHRIYHHTRVWLLFNGKEPKNINPDEAVIYNIDIGEVSKIVLIRDCQG